MSKIQKLDDLKNVQGKLTLNPQQFYKVLKENMAPANYDAVIALLNSTEEEAVKILKNYSKIEGDTFAKAVYNLMQNVTSNQPRFTLDDNSSVYRPLTFKENMIARLEDNSLFNDNLNSCTGIAYKKGSSLIKLNPETKELIMIPKKFYEASMDIDYDSFQGQELDASTTSNQDKWLVAMGGNNAENRDLYNNYQQKLHEITGISKKDLMNFYTINNPSKDQLRALCVVNGDSIAGGNYVLDNYARLLQVD